MKINHKYIWWDHKNLKSFHKTEQITRSKAIRLKCMDCCGFQNNEVRNCPATYCALWPFRMGGSRADDTVEKQLLEDHKD